MRRWKPGVTDYEKNLRDLHKVGSILTLLYPLFADFSHNRVDIIEIFFLQEIQQTEIDTEKSI